jgi:hypothetical protein
MQHPKRLPAGLVPGSQNLEYVVTWRQGEVVLVLVLALFMVKSPGWLVAATWLDLSVWAVDGYIC